MGSLASCPAINFYVLHLDQNDNFLLNYISFKPWPNDSIFYSIFYSIFFSTFDLKIERSRAWMAKRFDFQLDFTRFFTQLPKPMSAKSRTLQLKMAAKKPKAAAMLILMEVLEDKHELDDNPNFNSDPHIYTF